MKNVFDFLQLDHKHLQHQLCHPRRQPTFDNDAIQRKIQEIKHKKEQLRVQAQKKKQQNRIKQERYQEFPLEQVLQDSLQCLPQSITLLLKQKMKFIQDKVYLGSKNNINNQYISRIIDENQATPALKNQLNLFMEDLISNIQSEIVEGQYQIYNKKDIIINKNEQFLEINSNQSKMIQIKKNQLSNKIDELRQQLSKTELEQEKIIKSPTKKKKKNNLSVRQKQSLNIQDFSIKSQKTKEAEKFIKKIQTQQENKRIQRKKKQSSYIEKNLKQQIQKKQFQQQIKNEKHQMLKKKLQNQRQQKNAQFQKAKKNKQQYEKFLAQYRKKLPLYKQKQIQFNKNLQKLQKQRVLSVMSQIKQYKRSYDINEIKQHEKKYSTIKKQSQDQKLANLKHRNKQIYLRHKQDKHYFRGRYHSMIKQQSLIIPEDPFVSLTQRLKKKKQFVQKVKKQYIPQISQSKNKQIQELILKINRNKPNKQSKNYNQLGNQYLADLHKLVKQIKKDQKIKVQLPEQIKPRYRNYLQDLKRYRQYQTISYDHKDAQWIQKQSYKIQRNVQRKQKILKLTDRINIQQQFKKIDQIDMQLLKSAQMKVKLLNRYQQKTISKNSKDNLNSQEYDQSQYLYQ